MTEHPQKITFAEMRESGVRGTAPYLPAEYCVPNREYFDRCEDWTSVNCRRCCSWAGAFQVIGRAACLKDNGGPPHPVLRSPKPFFLPHEAILKPLIGRLRNQ